MKGVCNERVRNERGREKKPGKQNRRGIEYEISPKDKKVNEVKEGRKSRESGKSRQVGQGRDR